MPPTRQVRNARQCPRAGRGDGQRLPSTRALACGRSRPSPSPDGRRRRRATLQSRRRGRPRPRPGRQSRRRGTSPRWPAMSVATHGVPHAPPSVSDMPHPSACDALTTNHARRYASTRSSSPTRPRRSIQASAPCSAIHASTSARSGPSPTSSTVSSGNCTPRLGQRSKGESLTFHRGQSSDHDDVRVLPRRVGSGVKRSCTPGGMTVRCARSMPSSSISSADDSDSVANVLRR